MALLFTLSTWLISLYSLWPGNVFPCFYFCGDQVIVPNKLNWVTSGEFSAALRNHLHSSNPSQGNNSWFLIPRITQFNMFLSIYPLIFHMHCFLAYIINNLLTNLNPTVCLWEIQAEEAVRKGSRIWLWLQILEHIGRF